MKHLHFFGCSFTAGDELSDDVWFPWKHECKNLKEYYKQRHLELETNDNDYRYQLSNKSLAYPAKIDNNEYKTYNHAYNGQSLRRNIFSALRLIYGGISPIDLIFLQIPPVGRELYIDGEFNITSLTYSNAESYQGDLKKYLEYKSITHSIVQYSVEDLMDLLMLSNLCKQKNIPFYIIDFHSELITRLDDLKASSKFNFIIDNISKEIDVINFAEIVISAAIEKRKLLGGHYDQQSHQQMADKIKRKLPEIFNS